MKHTSRLAVRLGALAACAAAFAPASQAVADASQAMQAGPVKLTFGGFIETAGIFRNKNEEADVGSNYNNIPFPDTPLAHTQELRFSARQSRLSIRAQGPEDGPHKVEAYYEMDFLGTALSANSNESNSYNPRIRHIYLAYSNTDSGFSAIAGQTWSLVTLSKNGLMPQQQVTPLTIDAQYVPGFNWTRNPQLRLVQRFGDAVSLGLSVESPQASFKGKAPAGTTSSGTGNNGGGAQLNNSTTYSIDDVPDVVAKIALDPGFGHYELYGLGRQFRDRVGSVAGGSPENKTAFGGGFGFGAIVPVVPKLIDVQLSGLAGRGIGRYGSAQLPDATYNDNGSPHPIAGLQGLVGVIAHPTDRLDVYAYAGHERINNTYSASGAAGFGDGVGNSVAASACLAPDTPGVATATGALAGYAGGCNSAQSLTQFTIGDWWKFYKGPVGYLTTGAQVSYTRLTDFAGTVGGSRPNTALTTVMLSLRYYPYQ